MKRTGRTLIDDDAEKAETRPLEASMPLSIKGKLIKGRHPIKTNQNKMIEEREDFKMKKRLLVAAGVMGLLVLAGCQNTSSSETEQLKQQIAELEQQVTDLENRNETSDTTGDTANTSADTTTETAGTTERPSAPPP